MTDEEKREAAVEKMYDDILDKDGRVLIPTEFLLDYGLHKLYDAGYRKEEEVKKEVIKELLETTIFPIIDEGYANKETIKAAIRKTVAAHYDIEELSNKND